MKPTLASFTPEVMKTFRTFQRLPEYVTAPYRNLTILQLSATWPLLREEFARAGIDVDEAELTGDE